MTRKYVIVTARFANDNGEFICPHVFDKYTAAKCWCEKHYPKECEEDFEYNFIIRNYTKRGMLRFFRDSLDRHLCNSTEKLAWLSIMDAAIGNSNK